MKVRVEEAEREKRELETANKELLLCKSNHLKHQTFVKFKYRIKSLREENNELREKIDKLSWEVKQKQEKIDSVRSETMIAEKMKLHKLIEK